MIKSIISKNNTHSNPNIQFVLNFIRINDLNKLKIGKTCINENIYVVKEEYNTLSYGETFWESHNSFIDLQILIKGTEMIKYSHSSIMKVVAFDETKDLLIYKGKSNGNLVMIPGEFVIFFPEDVHMPGLSINNISSKVIKIVFKIKI